MKRIITAVLFVFTVSAGFSQDLEIFHRYQDDRIVPPVLPAGMTFDEYKLLSRDIRMSDMAASMALPGYISWKAEEKTAGIVAAALRGAGYAGALYEIIKYNNEGFTSVISNQFDRNFSYITMGVLVSSWLFDWIYGKTALEKKQEAIRYKYRQVLE